MNAALNLKKKVGKANFIIFKYIRFIFIPNRKILSDSLGDYKYTYSIYFSNTLGRQDAIIKMLAS